MRSPRLQGKLGTSLANIIREWVLNMHMNYSGALKQCLFRNTSWNNPNQSFMILCLYPALALLSGIQGVTKCSFAFIFHNVVLGSKLMFVLVSSTDRQRLHLNLNRT